MAQSFTLKYWVRFSTITILFAAGIWCLVVKEGLKLGKTPYWLFYVSLAVWFLALFALTLFELIIKRQRAEKYLLCGAVSSLILLILVWSATKQKLTIWDAPMVINIAILIAVLAVNYIVDRSSDQQEDRELDVINEIDSLHGQYNRPAEDSDVMQAHTQGPFPRHQDPLRVSEEGRSQFSLGSAGSD